MQASPRTSEQRLTKQALPTRALQGWQSLQGWQVTPPSHEPAPPSGRPKQTLRTASGWAQLEGWDDEDAADLQLAIVLSASFLIPPPALTQHP